MASTQANPTRTKTLTKTVFDLNTFDRVVLEKTVTLPAPMESVTDAIQAFGNDTEAVLAALQSALDARVATADSTTPWNIEQENEDGEKELVPYTGASADESKEKAINLGVLNLAKAFRMWPTKGDKEAAAKKRAAREKVIAMIRDNPAMLQSFQG